MMTMQMAMMMCPECHEIKMGPMDMKSEMIMKCPRFRPPGNPSAPLRSSDPRTRCPRRLCDHRRADAAGCVELTLNKVNSWGEPFNPRPSSRGRAPGRPPAAPPPARPPAERGPSGRTIRDLLERAGHSVGFYAVVRDDADAIADAVDRVTRTCAVVITNGGTGLTRRGGTIATLAPRFEKAPPRFR